MRFGTLMFPMSEHPENDGAVVHQALREAELTEEVGFDAVWLTEHHFGGTAAYADPVTFGAALAVRTSRIKIGFAVVQLALHHPVLLAAQTALVDQLSSGRLIVGTGRGSAYNHYEYIGFGTNLERGRAMLAESEELLVKAWVSKDLVHSGEFFNVSLPILRPRPFQQPHPLLVRACLGESSVVAMAQIARPILIGSRSDEIITGRLKMFHEAMVGAGLDDATIETTLNESWAVKKLAIADTFSEARDLAEEGYHKELDHELRNREMFNPPDLPTPPIETDEKDFEQLFIMGTPSQVADHIASLRDEGVRNLFLTINSGELDPKVVDWSIRMVGEKVLPQFK